MMLLLPMFTLGRTVAFVPMNVPEPMVHVPHTTAAGPKVTKSPVVTSGPMGTKGVYSFVGTIPVGAKLTIKSSISR